MKQVGNGIPSDKTLRWSLWFFGLASLVWLLLRSGTNPRRLAYPCQRIALMNSLNILVYPLWLIAGDHILDIPQRRIMSRTRLLIPLVFILVLELGGCGKVVPKNISHIASLPAWIGSQAVSDVFVVEEVPVPICSLDSGQLPTMPPCNDPQIALPDVGVDALVFLMQSKDTPFFATSSSPQGIISKDEVVLIKINNQWGGGGTGDGVGRMASNTDVLKGLIWRILNHPSGFTGEVVVVENAQPISENDWNVTPANAEDQGQTYQDVVAAFQSLGYPVSLYDWTALNNARINGGSIDDSSYPQGEYIQGNLDDAYIMLEDSDGTGSLELSYPKFRTASGRYVSLRYGVWDGFQYHSDQLAFINLPVLKRHGLAGSTGAWKNLIGYTSADGYSNNRFGSMNEMHNFYFGLTGGVNWNYGLLGRQMARVRAPDLSLMDAIWVAYENNTTGNAIRQDVLLASTDPFAVDWYASEFILLPITGNDITSAARAGTFRDATRVNQNSAFAEWPGGASQYPYMDLLDGYDGDTPSDDEKQQLNVYGFDPESTSLRLVYPNGGESWRAGSEQLIRWVWLQDTTEKVQLTYSTDGFEETFLISDSEPNDGEFVWTVPLVFSNTVRVRISSVDDPLIHDESDSDFSITRLPPGCSSCLTYLPFSLNRAFP